MTSIARSWLSELDQAILAHGGAGVLESSGSSEIQSVLLLRDVLDQHVANHGSAELPSDFAACIPINLPPRVPKQPQRYRMTSSAAASSSAASSAEHPLLVSVGFRGRVSDEEIAV